MAQAIVKVVDGRAVVRFSGPEAMASTLALATASAQAAAIDADRAVEAKDEIVAISDLIEESLIPPTLNVGTVQPGSSNLISVNRTISEGADDGTSQVYSLVNRVYADGANDYDSVRAQYSGTHINTTAGTTTNADGLHQYVWVSGAGNVTYSQVVASHLRVDGPGDVGEAILFRGVSTTLGPDATVGTLKGVSMGQIGDPTKVTNVYCYDAEDTSAISVAIAFRSTFMAGANKYAFFGAGTAPSAFGGKVGIGITSSPGWALTVKATEANWSSDIQNDHASNPYGVRVRYTGAAPSSGDNYFYSGFDTSGQKFGIASNGRYQIGPHYVLNSRQAAIAAPTGGSTVDAEARAKINEILAVFTAHGLTF